MPRSLTVIKDNKQVLINPYPTLQEYFIAVIQDVDDDETQIWNSTPYEVNSYNITGYKGCKQDREWDNAFIHLHKMADFIMMTNPLEAYPLIYDIGDGNRLEIKFLVLYKVQSYYPPEILNAPYVKREHAGDWRFWNGKIGVNGQTNYHKYHP